MLSQFLFKNNAPKLDWILNKLCVMDFLARFSDKILTWVRQRDPKNVEVNCQVHKINIAIFCNPHVFLIVNIFSQDENFIEQYFVNLVIMLLAQIWLIRLKDFAHWQLQLHVNTVRYLIARATRERMKRLRCMRILHLTYLLNLKI
jgi:hypothetical protein